ncbi:MAG TPA: hypothetical protein VE961_10705 [Pyrinomonadaceae bacterium]|nr:hypothetical protein [Pyrinomonadaceae bacterium]
MAPFWRCSGFASAPPQAQTSRNLRDLPDWNNSITAFDFSPDGRVLAIACGSRVNNRVELWDTQSGTLRRTIAGFDGPVRSVSFSPDGRTVVTGSSGLHPRKISEKISRPNGDPFTELKWWDAQTGARLLFYSHLAEAGCE